MLPRAVRILILAAGLLGLASCFDPPVRESVRLRFLQDGVAIVTSAVELDPLAQGEKNPALDRRLSDLRRDLLAGLDPWAQRFDAIDPAAERFSWEKHLGLLTGAKRSAVLDDPAKLRSVFADTALAVTYEVRQDGVAELTIVPGAPSQATRKQRKELEGILDNWSADVAEYLAATADLYDWLEDNPTRAEVCMQALFGDVLAEEDAAPEGETEPETELSAEEQKRVDRVQEAMTKVLDVLLIPKGQDRSIDELSHLVYDPFPAPLSIQLPDEPLEVEGFEASGAEDRVWSADTPGLWAALRSLEERWVAPDPVMVYVEHKGAEAEGLDLSALLDTPRKVVRPLPNSLEIRKAIEERLKPAASVYRAAWKTKPRSDDDKFSWED
ncbi:MAG TPA: hypothetical protein VH394_07595 [Thermoanaerobaculia bacterium]|jgi:hypothetical protein|nr:hypothetical protein [Thermoanaerobaculia bacterium]